MTYVSMRYDFAGDALPNRDELRKRWEISDLIEERHIGEVIGSGGGLGQMDIGIEVADLETAKSQLRAIAADYKLKNVTYT